MWGVRTAACRPGIKSGLILTCCTSGYLGPKYRPVGFLSLWCLHTRIHSSADYRRSTPGRKTWGVGSDVVTTGAQTTDRPVTAHCSNSDSIYQRAGGEINNIKKSRLDLKFASATFLSKLLLTLCGVQSPVFCWRRIKGNQHQQNLNNSNWAFEEDKQLSDSHILRLNKDMGFLW